MEGRYRERNRDPVTFFLCSLIIAAKKGKWVNQFQRFLEDTGGHSVGEGF